MNKAQLVDAIAEAISQPKNVATEALDALLNSVRNALVQNIDVVIAGFGTFSVKERSAREGRNPKTGEKIQIAASKAPAFKAAKGLKDAINS